MIKRLLLSANLLYFGIIHADGLLNPYMDSKEYELFVYEVSEAVSAHPEYLSSLDSLKAA